MAALALLVAVSVVLGSAWLAYRWRRVRRYWADRGVPASEPHPVWGSLTFLQRLNPIIWFCQEYDKFSPSPYYGIWFFWRPALVICSPELARNILVKDAEVFRDRFLSSSKHDPTGALNIFTVNDPVWTSIRRQLTSIFTSAKLKALHPLRLLKAKELLQRIRMEMKTSKKIDIRDLYANYTTDIIATASFGMKNDATLTGDSPVRSVTRSFMQYSLWRGLSWCSIFFFPELVDIFRFKMFPKESIEVLKKVYSTMAAQRESERKDNVTKDLLDALINIKKEGLDGKEISDDVIIAQAAIFLQGGFDTSAVALTFATYEMAYNPEIQERLYQEILEVKERLGTSDFDQTTLSEMTYLNCVIKETLRKYPAMGFLDRIAARTYKVDDKLTIEKGTPVYVLSAGMHFDPQYFPEPRKFDPDRFLPENEKNIKPYTYMPFGEGPRNCIGTRFGYETLRAAISTLVLHLKLSPHPDAPAPHQVGIDERGIFLAPATTLSVRFTERN